MAIKVQGAAHHPQREEGREEGTLVFHSPGCSENTPTLQRKHPPPPPSSNYAAMGTHRPREHGCRQASCKRLALFPQEGRARAPRSNLIPEERERERESG